MQVDSDVFDKKYQLIDSIGDGHTSIVYKAYSVDKPNIPLAIKAYNSGVTPLKEAEIYSLLPENIYVIPLIDHKVYDDKPSYAVFEYAQGGCLAEYTKKAIGEKLSKNIMTDIINGISFLHSNKIAHRDIKPLNILLVNDYRAVLCDLGLSGVVEDGIMSDSQMGTSAYMAPEIYLKVPYDRYITDIFALGVTLFAIVTGYLPFGKHLAQNNIYQYIYAKNYSTFWQYASNLTKCTFSQEFKDLFMGMVQYNPSERLSMEEIQTHKWFNELLDPVVFGEEMKKRRSKRR